jgi:hypothetical protein
VFTVIVTNVGFILNDLNCNVIKIKKEGILFSKPDLEFENEGVLNPAVRPTGILFKPLSFCSQQLNSLFC